MKKSILAVAVVLGSTSLFAQDLTSKKGEAFLPEAGDWALSIDATPFLNYFGNFIGGNGLNTAPSFNYLTANNMITGKYFVDAETAYRASLRIGFGSTKGEMEVTDRSSSTAPVFPGTVPAMVMNNYKMGTTNIGLSVGLEKRRGFGRLVGVYGAELGFMIGSSKNTYEYGNALTSNTAAVNVDLSPADNMLGGINQTGVTDVFGNPGRITESKSGTSFGFGLRGFIGAEYFVIPRLSVGGEFGWGLAFNANGTGSTTMESEGINAAGDEETLSSTAEVSNGSSFGIDTDNLNKIFGASANLKITFHF
tara:strand:+ start:1151 stop:2074 length:924 start_codon:yes stop_codon:yes gene_type:complete